MPGKLPQVLARLLYHKSLAVTGFAEFPDRGHPLTIGHSWREAAQRALGWLNQRSLQPPAGPQGGWRPARIKRRTICVTASATEAALSMICGWLVGAEAANQQD